MLVQAMLVLVMQQKEMLEMQDLVTPQTLEQFQELSRVFEEINSPELAEALERLREAMKDVDLTEIQKSIGDVEFNEEQFLERLKRALELFKRLRTVQKLEEAARRAEDLLIMARGSSRQIPRQASAALMTSLIADDYLQRLKVADYDIEQVDFDLSNFQKARTILWNKILGRW